ncbi:MAG: GNAT family N-acetyltransferase [Anaerolineales bacterium]|nr:GNAT family N-acetyltransferase [Anaerolineales bacterium]
MALEARRRAIQPLLDRRHPADAMAVYYAFFHDANKTQILTWPPMPHNTAEGFITISRTGIDLFRPFMTMRLPLSDLEASAELLQMALPVGAEAFMSVPLSYEPLIRAFCDVLSEERLHLYQLTQMPEPEVNVLVTRADLDGLPRFVVKQVREGRRITAASANLNWLTTTYAEIAVNTRSEYRQKGYGRAVVRALAAHLRKHGRVPLYAVNPQNTPSVNLARGLGFTLVSDEEVMLEVRRRPPLR